MALTPATPTAPAVPAPISVGGGRYQIGRFLGEGTKKRVYLGRDTRLDSDVAVALIKSEGLDTEGLIRVQREAQAMGRLRDHPYIVPVFDIGEENGRPYIVSQFLEGGALADHLAGDEQRRLPVDEAVRVAAQVCEALQHAHANGIVHRDLKPGNIWLTPDGTAKLGDFGLAVALDRSRLTQEGMLVGTVAYIAPEQAMGRVADARSDLYALGATLYEMLTGRPPFLGEDAVSIISQHINTPPVSPSWHTAEIQQPLEDLVLRLLEKDLDKRPTSAGAVAEELRRLGERASAPSEVPPDHRPEEQVRGRGGVARFVGRQAELDQLKETLEKAFSGRGCMAMLVGEPGIGKTRLSEEFCVYAGLRGAQILKGRSYEGAMEIPYLPFVEAFRQYVRTRPDDDLRRELGDAAPEIGNLVSEVRQRFPDVPEAPRLEGDAERLRLFESVAEFLRNASTSRPLVLVLDDLHWADKPSLLLLRHLARDIGNQRLLVVGTYRDVELDRSHPLAEVLFTLRREPVYQRILLRGLPQDDIVALLGAMAEDEPDEDTVAARRALAKALYQETEGNPFFIGEVVNHLVEEGKIFFEAGRWTSNVGSVSELGIPEGVREVVGRRLSRLGEACNEMLTIAAAMPAGFRWEVLAAVSGEGEAQLLDLLDEALHARLIHELKDARAGTYEFSHALIRQTLYEELSTPRRVLLHRRIGEALERLYGGDAGPHVAELAYHFFHAAPGGDVDKAVDYAVKAGRRASANVAHEEAVAHYERALQALDLKPTDDPAPRCDLLLALEEEHVGVPAVDRAREVGLRAADIARSLGDTPRLALAAIRMSFEGVIGTSVDEARVALLQEALTRLEGSGERVLEVRVLCQLAAIFALVEVGRARPFADRALSIARELGDAEPLVYALNAQQWMLGSTPEEVDARLTIGGEIAEVARKAGVERWQASSQMGRSYGLLERGDAREAKRESEAFWRVAAQLREPSGLWQAKVLEGLWAILEGRFEDAEQIANDALNRARRFGHDVGVQMHAIQISRVRAEQGRLEELLPVLESIIRASPNPAWMSRVVQIYAELDREEDARREFGKMAVEGFADVQRDLLWSITMTYLAEAAAYLKDAAHCQILYEQLLPLQEQNVVVAFAACNGPVARYLGLLAAALGRWDEAERHFGRALDMDRRLGARALLARHQGEFARMLLERDGQGDRERALQLANEALASAQEMGMKIVVERLLATKLAVQGVASSDTQHSVYAVASVVQQQRPDLSSHASPDGTVTLMFSDMEDFTGMTERLGDVEAHRVVQAHNQIVRELTAAHGGHEVELRGDGFLLAFASARQAAQCAIALQRAFCERAENETGQPLRVRIGLHTGEAIKDADKFFGRTVIQAFRIADLAAGGEILVSSLTGELVSSAGDLRLGTPREVDLKGLSGTHRVVPLEWSRATESS